VVHFAGDLLAAGIAGADFVSVGVVDFVAISDLGDCGGGSARFVEGNTVLTWKDFARAASGVVGERKSFDSATERARSIFIGFDVACRASGARELIGGFPRALRPGLTYAAPPALE
jgi:hypothetical protein